ncbi:MAG TPA: DNA photolyase [Pseudobacteroides sp.]|uniref:SPL family radical SAM protein n=1 Tax=Pseudobacteroides sp. TaxID=1968840 RepID=UPI002F9417D0
MNKSSKISGKTPFNTIYIEENAFDYPITRDVLKDHPCIPVVKIRCYKDVFNRKKQNFSIQKQYPSLILAVKEDTFLYEGPKVCQSFGHANFYYTSFLLNCIFNCEYCYLQGMYPSANLVAFVNIHEYKTAIKNASLNAPLYLAASYDTDLIGFHKLIPYMDYFYEFFNSNTNITVEIRTKSGSQSFYKAYSPLDNIIIAFTLSPEEIIRKFEKHTPSLDIRLKAINTAINEGYKVRLCLDPVFINPETDDLYEPFFRYIFNKINPDSVFDVGYGFFRMSNEFFKRIGKHNNSSLFAQDYCLIDDIISYPLELQEKVKSNHIKMLSQYIKKERIFSL